ncbi:MAG: 2-amino-4-hydroxy-6-hydroxymethyldihydropteridine diphosphokinase [Gemmatimonadales bacterium]|nr:2-amino-4-hydroxy-6-hydroxymethyldihydropteridine diphosphokinase [Gemmatimonadales bacterium]
MTKSEPVAIALGSNLGDREAALAGARAAIARLPGTRIMRASAVLETEPLGPVPQAEFLNQMLLVETTLEPRALLEALLLIERAAGRVRGERWGPRTLDCDIVLFGDRVVNESGLVIPHPEIPNRAFWQRELAELHVAHTLA